MYIYLHVYRHLLSILSGLSKPWSSHSSEAASNTTERGNLGTAPWKRMCSMLPCLPSSLLFLQVTQILFDSSYCVFSTSAGFYMYADAFLQHLASIFPVDTVLFTLDFLSYENFKYLITINFHTHPQTQLLQECNKKRRDNFFLPPLETKHISCVWRQALRQVASKKQHFS